MGFFLYAFALSSKSLPLLPPQSYEAGACMTDKLSHYSPSGETVRVLLR